MIIKLNPNDFYQGGLSGESEEGCGRGNTSPFPPCSRIFPNFYIQLQMKENLINHGLKKKKILSFGLT